MEPRHLGVRAIVVRSFARIHETNLKKQGMLALTFANKEDYEKVQEDDSIDITGLTSFAPGKPLTMVLHHKDGSTDQVTLNHTYNQPQIGWFKAGGALNVIRAEVAKNKIISRAPYASPTGRLLHPACPRRITRPFFETSYNHKSLLTFYKMFLSRASSSPSSAACFFSNTAPPSSLSCIGSKLVRHRHYLFLYPYLQRPNRIPLLPQPRPHPFVPLVLHPLPSISSYISVY